MELDIYIKSISALVFVLALIGLAVWAGRKFGLITSIPKGIGRKKRLQVLENVALDQRRRMVLVRRDDVEHLLILGQDHSTVIEAGIAGAKPQSSEMPVGDAAADQDRQN